MKHKEEDTSNYYLGGVDMNKVGFSYEKFCEYVRNKMSMIYENKQGEYQIMEDTQPLQHIIPNNVELFTEEGTLRYIYDNKLFEQVEELIRTQPTYIYALS